MIKVNLITEKKKKKKKKKKLTVATSASNVFKIFIIATTASVLIFGGASAYFEYGLYNLKKEAEIQKQNLERLRKQAQETKKNEEIKKQLETTTRLIESFIANQKIPVNILNKVSLLMPDTIWLVSLTYTPTVTLEGYGFSNSEIVSFVEALKREFHNVFLLESKQEEIEKTTVYKFKITFEPQG